MSVRTLLQTYLPAALNALVGTSFKVDVDDIYFDSRTRYDRSGTEILLTWGGRKVENAQTGRWITSAINIELFVATTDLVIDPDLRIEDKIEAAALTIVEAFDNDLDEFNSALSCTIDRVKCFEKSSIDRAVVGGDMPRVHYKQQIGLEITALESD